MAELEKVLEIVCDALAGSNVNSFICGYPHQMKKRYEKPVVAVSVRGGSGIPAGFCEYIGERYDSDRDVYREIYGKRLALTIGLDIYSPKNASWGAGACMTVFSKILEMIGKLPDCLKVKEIQCGEVGFDENTDMFLCPAEIKCTAFMYAESKDDGEILDFSLRGVMK